MKKLLIMAVLPLLFFACAKEEDVNPPLPSPTCADTTDDGIFEKFNSPETALFLRKYKNIPETEDSSALGVHYITSREIENKGTIYDPKFIYLPRRPIQMMVYLPYYRNTQQVYSWVRSANFNTTDPDTVNIFNARLLNLPVGCYRLYYVVSDTGYGKVYTKGHYDLTIR